MNYYFSKLDFIVPLSLLIFTAGGGMEQTGRYIMYSMPSGCQYFSATLFFLRKKCIEMSFSLILPAYNENHILKT